MEGGGPAQQWSAASVQTGVSYAWRPGSESPQPHLQPSPETLPAPAASARSPQRPLNWTRMRALATGPRNRSGSGRSTGPPGRPWTRGAPLRAGVQRGRRRTTGKWRSQPGGGGLPPAPDPCPGRALCAPPQSPPTPLRAVGAGGGRGRDGGGGWGWLQAPRAPARPDQLRPAQHVCSPLTSGRPRAPGPLPPWGLRALFPRRGAGISRCAASRRPGGQAFQMRRR